jgi:hypothetical protein
MVDNQPVLEETLDVCYFSLIYINLSNDYKLKLKMIVS